MEPWSFINAASEVGELASHVAEIRGGGLVPFASREDDGPEMACFDATDTSGNPPVRMLVLDDPDRSYGHQDFAAWLGAAQAEAAAWQASIQKLREAWLKGR